MLRRSRLEMEVAHSIRSAKVTVDTMRGRGAVEHGRAAKNKMNVAVLDGE